MYIYFAIIAGGFVLLGCVISLLWAVLARSRKYRILSVRDASLSSEELEDHARKTAIRHTISNRRSILNWPLPRMNDNYACILSVYRKLNEEIQKKSIVPSTAEWLLDNFYIIEEQVKLVRRDLSRKSYLRLPVLRSGPMKEYARIFAVATDFASHTDGQINDVLLANYLNAYQSHSILFEREIRAIPMVMTLVLLESIRHLCDHIKETLLQWNKADEMVDRWLEAQGDDVDGAMKLFKSGFLAKEEIDPSYIEHLFYRLRRSGRSYVGVLRAVDEHLAKFDTDTAHIAQQEHNVQSADKISIGNCVTSLRFLSTLDWTDLFEATSFVERILKRDPDGTYPLMDIATRGDYRSKVEEFASAYGVSELHIAKESIALAQNAYEPHKAEAGGNPAMERTYHVGYYLIGKGNRQLADRQDGDRKVTPRAVGLVKNHPGRVYLGSVGLVTMLLVAVAVLYTYLGAPSHALLLSILAAVFILLPASDIAVSAVNWVVCKTIRPVIFPRMSLLNGIPESMGTIVAVPTLLPDAKRVVEILKNLEEHYLRNREENLYFALIGAFKDSDSSVSRSDDEIVRTGMGIVAELNRKYAGNGKDIFYFFQRKSQYNKQSKKWFGWERKRGALMEFNDLVLGSTKTSFAYSSCSAPPFSNIRYIITLDSDTILPMGMAKKMIGTMAHPLNRPVVDKKRGIVIEGYGLMQPRIDIDSESSGKTLFARIFAGHEGLDPYANAISDVYQDLFGEGIFTGKGIYDLHVFQSVLSNAIPDNTVLSHDLLEGSYVRTGLLTDLRLVDSFPAQYNSFAARLRRWVRGDWQLFPLLFRRIKSRSSMKIRNPLTSLTKWKIFDNMRRSLISPALMVLAALGFCLLPGNVFFWLGYFFAALMLPFGIAVIEYVLAQHFASDRIKRHIPVITGLRAALLQGLLTLTFLPYQALMMAGAILVTLGRVFITKKNMLEWITSADVEKNQKNTLSSYWHMMRSSVCTVIFIPVFALVFKPAAFLISLPLLLLWASSPLVGYFTSKERSKAHVKASPEEVQDLRRIARKTWRYFEEFSNSRSHYLPPDNYQVDPPRGIAHRTSPTNIGMGLLAILSARDFGYIHTGRMVELLDHSVSTIETLEKWNGHLYNWYDTYTLQPMRPCYISTVDSGNYVGNLIALGQGLKEYLIRPLVDSSLADGIIDTLRCAGKDGVRVYESSTSLHSLPAGKPVSLILWSQALYELLQGDGLDSMKESVWKDKAKSMVIFFQKELADFLPHIGLLKSIPPKWDQSEAYKEIAAGRAALIGKLQSNVGLTDLPFLYTEIIASINGLIKTIFKSAADPFQEELTWLGKLKEAIIKANGAAGQFIHKITGLIGRIDVLAAATKFLPLYVKERRLFSIGYNMEESKLTNSYYDLLASEARLASYISIARGEISYEHWFRMSRALTVVDGYKGLVSWSGTMFEYLMPLLTMKSYRNSLLDETYSFVIKSQIKYGRQKGMPWGVSESQFNSLDKNHDYQYKAIGVPWLGLKRGLIEDAVVAPYASFLALLVQPQEAIRNIGRLKQEGMDGSHGFYEAADYTPERLPFETKRAIVKSFMAHHQGMSLLALSNFLHHNVLQNRFNADPEIHAARLLLQEKVPSNLVFTKEIKEKVLPFKGTVIKEKSPVRKFSLPDPVLPNTHILSNGSYSVMITDRGTGYSKNSMVAVTRWRADSTLDPYGMFFYVKNVADNSVWSTTYSPLNELHEKYEVVFTADKAVFKRTDGRIETQTEVVVASGDDVEIRRVAFKNTGETTCVLEVTSYFEVVLAPQAADAAHPAFSNLFVETGYQADKQCIFAHRRSRSEAEKGLWIANTAVVEGDTAGEIQYETDRMQWIGRGRGMKAPAAIVQSKPLSNTVGPVLDPVMSLRIRVKVEPGKTVRISFVVAVSENKELLFALVDKYASTEAVEYAFQLAQARSQIEKGYLNLKASEITLYQDMLRDILFISSMRRANQGLIMKNRQGQSSLWRYGISGDLPVILVVLSKADRLEILYDVLKAHEYWRLMDIKVDLVLLSEEEYSYALQLHSLISDIVLSRQTNNVMEIPKDVFILDRSKLPADDVYLLYASARVILKGDGTTMSEQMSIRLKLPLPQLRKVTCKAAVYTPPSINQRKLAYNNGLGGFCTDDNEYVIQLEKGQNTPAPWVNVIANPAFGFIVSESGSGSTWSENSHENKLTAWTNDSVCDSPGEALYIGDTDTGELWTATSLPIREDEPYTVHHGFGYSIFEHASHGIEQSLTQFVPMDEAVKISILRLKNNSGQKRHLALTYYMQPVMGVSEQDTAMHIHTYMGDRGVLLIENHYNQDFAGRICFVDASIEDRTVTGDRKEFFGSGGMDAPDCLKREKLSGTLGMGLDPCAALQVNIILEADACTEVSFLIGISTQLSEIEKITHKYRNMENVLDSLMACRAFWRGRTGTVQVDTPSQSMDLMLNGWLQYQVISCRLWERAGFYQSGGAYGFRDQLQDCLSVAHLWPEAARKQILAHAGHQFVQGDVMHWWHEPQGKGTRTRSSDDLLWLPYAAAEYCRITGDFPILKENVPFLEDKVLMKWEDERYGTPAVSNESASLFEHCIRAVEKALCFGIHGLPLMGSGDWNDGMNTVGNKGTGESVWLGWFLASVLEKMQPLCLDMGDAETAGRYADIRQKLAASLETHTWDGSWYKRAFFDNGMSLGSAQNSECRIDSIAQTWAVISDAGDPKRAVQAMQSLEDYLILWEEGIIKLLAPPFDGGEAEPGYIKGYVPGVRENGGQYTHAAAWVIIAYAKLGEGNKAWELFELINPINHTRSYREFSRYKTEPYVMTADVYAVYPHVGRGGWSWYTGSAGWMYRAGLEYILGFQKNGDMVTMDPCIPSKWHEYTITYQYLNTPYVIHILNPGGLSKGVKSISADGVLAGGNTIKLINDRMPHDILVNMGQ
jgi:cellobiose phosphorylase